MTEKTNCDDAHRIDIPASAGNHLGRRLGRRIPVRHIVELANQLVIRPCGRNPEGHLESLDETTIAVIVAQGSEFVLDADIGNAI